VTTAVILAAGLGTRLRPWTDDRPKALVTVAGRPLLAGLLDVCAVAGCVEALVVTGQFQEAITGWLATNDVPLATRCIYNEAYASHGNAWSLRVALASIESGDVLKLDGDLIVDPRIVERLLAVPVGSVLAIDRGAHLDDEAMKLMVDATGRVTALGKAMDKDVAHGESIGIEKIIAGDIPRVISAIDALMETTPNAYYEDVYQRLVADGWHLGSLSVEASRWTEIDAAEDFARGERLARKLARRAGRG
jgi:choline kinase